VVGLVEGLGTAGIGTMTVNGNLNNAFISASSSGGAGIKSLTVNGGITGGTLITSGGGIGTLTVKGNANLILRSAGTVGAFTMAGTSTQGYTLSGILDVKVLTSLSGTNTDLNNLTIRASDSIGTMTVRGMTDSVLSAGVIGTLSVSKNVTGSGQNKSLILAGYDIGADDLFGTADDTYFTSGAATGNIGAITIGGTMSCTSIAANVAPGPGYIFGAGGETMLSSTLQGAITSLTVGAFGSTSSSGNYGIMAHRTLGTLRVGAQTWHSPISQVFGNIKVLDLIS